MSILFSLLSWWLSVAMTVTSPDFQAGGTIPSMFTCDGAGTSPALHIAAVPPGAKALAIIVNDPDAPHPDGFTHWVAWNITPATDIPRNFKGGVQGNNGAGKSGYMGPCPPSGVHHYHFIVYALDGPLSISSKSDKAALEQAMQGHILAHAEIVGLYQKKN